MTGIEVGTIVFGPMVMTIMLGGILILVIPGVIVGINEVAGMTVDGIL